MARAPKKSGGGGVDPGYNSGDIKVRLDVQNDNSRQIAQAIKQQLAQALEAVGLDAESNAKKIITKNRSVDTGRLRNSITHQLDVSSSRVYIGTNVPYAPYVELGTYKTKPKAYLVPAATKYKSRYIDIFKSYLKDG